jgi:hypothetical protein
MPIDGRFDAIDFGNVQPQSDDHASSVLQKLGRIYLKY